MAMDRWDRFVNSIECLIDEDHEPDTVTDADGEIESAVEETEAPTNKQAKEDLVADEAAVDLSLIAEHPAFETVAALFDTEANVDLVPFADFNAACRRAASRAARGLAVPDPNFIGHSCEEQLWPVWNGFLAAHRRALRHGGQVDVGRAERAYARVKREGGLLARAQRLAAYQAALAWVDQADDELEAGERKTRRLKKHAGVERVAARNRRLARGASTSGVDLDDVAELMREMLAKKGNGTTKRRGVAAAVNAVLDDDGDDGDDGFEDIPSA